MEVDIEAEGDVDMMIALKPKEKYGSALHGRLCNMLIFMLHRLNQVSTRVGS